MLDCKATDVDDPTVDPRFGKVGKQTIKDTGPLTKKRMETIDDDIADRAVDFIERQAKADKPFFVWVNFTHMHFRTHAKPESVGQSGRWHERVPRRDDRPRQERRHGAQGARRRSGIADNTFVMYSTDNGPHMNTWPDARHDPVPQREELELGRGLPRALHGPLAGQDQAGHRSRTRSSATTTGCRRLLAMAGDPDVKEKLLKGYQVGDMTYKVHLDGYNLVPYLTGQDREEPARVVHLLQRRPAGDRPALRQLEAGVHGAASPRARCGSGPSRSPRSACRRSSTCGLDPYERADVTSNTYYDWLLDHVFLLVPAQDYVGKFLMTFKEFPQRQKAASFNLDEVMRS